MAGFGIVEAAQRARAWGPHLETSGQRAVLGGLVLYTGSDSLSDPTIGQLADWSGFLPRAIRRILTELTDLGAIAPLSERLGGRSRQTPWTIKPGPQSPGFENIEDTKPGPPRSKPGPQTAQTRTDESPSEVSEISEDDNLSDFYLQVVQLRQEEDITIGEAIKRIATDEKHDKESRTTGDAA